MNTRTVSMLSGVAPCVKWTLCLIIALIAALWPGPISAADEPAIGADQDPAVEEPEPAETPSAKPDDLTIYDRVMVVGGVDKIREIPGSAAFIDQQRLNEQGYSDLQRILRQVPGVNIQDEEGYGLRPNIGMRGTGVERSAKITLLEDGVPIAPAPYAAPSAYYVPVAGRMSAIEVRKGSSAVRQGPYTTGGVLNLVSTDIPGGLGARLDASYGDDATGKLHAVFGDGSHRFAWMVETYQFETDGFKRLDGGGDTGVRLEDYLVKLRYTTGPEAERFQALELKAGQTEQRGFETYLGLTEADFAADPYRRYVASADDRIDSDHEQLQLRWLVEVSDRVDVTTTLYRNDFFRNWHKLEKVAGVGISSILSDPITYADELAVVRGEIDSAAGALQVRNNRRDYRSEGVESVAGLRLGSGRHQHDVEFGVRIHRDDEDRFQEEDRYSIVDGDLEFLGLGVPGSQSNRISSANAIAVFAQDRFELGRLIVRPGVRFESVDFERRDFGKSDPLRTGDALTVRENGVDVWVPGLGVDYRIGDSLSLFAGVHKGFAPPGPGKDADTEAEESLNYEFGVRRFGDDLTYEVVGFYSDYDNLLGRDSLSSGGQGTGDLFNGGAVEVRGLEASLGFDLGTRLARSISLPVRLAYTLTEGKFQSSFETSFADWAPRVEVGDELPYLPEHQLHATFGVSKDTWSTYLGVNWSSEMRTRPGQGEIPRAERTDEQFTLDLSADLSVWKNLRIKAQVRNLTDEVYAVSRRPAGLRPGLPRTVMFGFSWER